MYKYKLKGLDCPVCAKEIEEKLNELKYKIIIDYSKKSIISDEEIDIDLLNNKLKKIEPGVKVVTKEENENLFKIIKIVTSAILLISAFFLEDYIVLFYVFGSLAYLIAGYNVIIKALFNIRHGKIFDENFLMLIASLGAFFLGDLVEAGEVMVLYSLGEYLQDLAVSKSRQNIKGLLDLNLTNATAVINDTLVEKDYLDIVIGDTLLVKKGEKIAFDSILLSSSATLDTRLITGESLPVEKAQDELLVSGSINMDNPIYVKVVKEFKDSTIERLRAFIEDSNNYQSKKEKIISKFAAIYTPIVCFLAVLVAFFVPFIVSLITKDNYLDLVLTHDGFLYKALLFLVISCPCAIVLSVPLTYFSAIGTISRRGLLVKNGESIEEIAGANMIVLDKTGTLTEGIFVLKEVISYGLEKDFLVAIASSLEALSVHPISAAFKNLNFNLKVSDFKEVTGKGISGVIDGTKYYIGSKKMLKDLEILEPKERDEIYLVKEKEVIGVLIVRDKLRDNSKEFIKLLQKDKYKVVILSGDSKKVVQEVASELGISDYRYELLPEDKLNIIEEYREKGNKVLYVGDGINDLAAFVKADVGIAIGLQGIDATVEVADSVLVSNNILKVFETIKLSISAKQKITQNIIFAISFKFIFLALSLFNLLPMTFAVLSDVGVLLLCILNSLLLFINKPLKKK
ncbi:MAG: heavy metal translocating P-type ATPase [Acholeplasmatales bacterium]|jgi:Cd2+/Zn2+-exporting ATPase|nr:heavy metal translocating P-type ATPase [Acholeplasmatales bacterium]